MKKTKPTNFEKYLNRQLKDKTFRRHYKEEGRILEVAYKINQLRRKKKLTQAGLAKKIGTTQSVVARIESGQQNVTLNSLVKIAHALDRDVEVKFVK